MKRQPSYPDKNKVVPFNQEKSFDNKKRMSFAMYDDMMTAEQQHLDYFVQEDDRSKSHNAPAGRHMSDMGHQYQNISKPVNLQGPDVTQNYVNHQEFDNRVGNNQDGVFNDYTQETSTALTTTQTQENVSPYL